MNSPNLPLVLKWTFAALVLLNVALLMWGLWHRRPPVDEMYQPQPEVNPERLVPLASATDKPAERHSEPGQRPRPALPLAPVRPERNATSLQCFSVGPFDSDEAVDSAETRLKEAHLSFARRTQAQAVESSYWVHIPPLASRAAAEERIKQLNQLGIKEHIIMQEPGMENAISLGLFARAENARGFLEELKNKGVEDARQDVRYRNESRVWLDVRTPVAVELIEQLRLAPWGVSGVEVRAHGCPSETVPVPGQMLPTPPAPVAPLQGPPAATGDGNH